MTSPHGLNQAEVAPAHNEDQRMKRSCLTEEQIIGILRSMRPAFRSPIYAASAATIGSIDGIPKLRPRRRYTLCILEQELWKDRHVIPQVEQRREYSRGKDYHEY